MKGVSYSEWVPADKFVKAIMGFVSLLALFVLVMSVWVSLSIRNPLFAVVNALPLTFMLVLYGNYRGIQIRIDAKELTIHYGLLNRKHVQMSDIVSCELTKANLGKYWGVGVRYGTDRSFAYTTSFGNAVKIVLKKERPFVFSSHNPKEICDIINQAKTNIPLGNIP